MDEENKQVESVEEQVTPVPEAPIEEAAEAEPQEQPEEQEEQKGADQRIRELNHRAKVAEEQARSLQERVAELTQASSTEQYTPNVQPGEEITPERYTQDVTKTADSIVNLRMKQYEAETRIKSETDQVTKDYPQLRKGSSDFDPELSDTITEAVEAHIRVNPYSASVKKFVDKLMKPYKQAVDKEVGQATEKIAKQVSETALRPTSVRKQEKTANEKSIAELEAELGVVNS